ncbi:MAG: heavy-metal-associated domain-containing protein [Gemmatimonadota bacterium]|nr:MAG: heavy-metal-associated domain-containing protein [Gemmatimonadota bacterium]
MDQTNLRVAGMSCEGCVNAVRNALTGVAGVRDVTVSLDEKSARVLHDGSTTTADLLQAVESAGYSAEQT